MNTDISTMFTKERNLKEGRKGYCAWKREKDTVIRPDGYGMFLNSRKVKSRKRK